MNFILKNMAVLGEADYPYMSINFVELKNISLFPNHNWSFKYETVKFRLFTPRQDILELPLTNLFYYWNTTDGRQTIKYSDLKRSYILTHCSPEIPKRITGK